MTIEQIMHDMAQDIRADIHGDIYGHERWAEEIFRLRQEVKALKDKLMEQSWSGSVDRQGGSFDDFEAIDRGWN